jgi:hypothetical protein|tara:strand:+ start:6720 stop:6863 length:144 start_codon:yes stop_codon:yes gene_type:complete
MFTLDDYEDEILDKLSQFFYEAGESVSDEVLSQLAEHISALIPEQDS